MRSSIPSFLLLLTLLFCFIQSSQALIFPKPTVRCSDPTSSSTCPRGQTCNDDSGFCEPSLYYYSKKFLSEKRALFARATTLSTVIVSSTSTSASSAASASSTAIANSSLAAITTDGTCGAANDNTICGDWFAGSCCSQYGYCGNTTAHCGAGCQSGDCITTGVVTIDGTCGVNYGNTVCDDWESGNCCSQYGFCGSGDDYCGTGCQSGDCLAFSSDVSSVASSTPSSSKSSSSSSASSTPISSSSTKVSSIVSSSKVSSTVSSSLSSSTKLSSSSTTLSSSSFVSPLLSSSQEPVLGSPSATTYSQSHQATALVTTDGTCGAQNNDTVCGNWAQGNCCSQYGYCGDTTAHCGTGCQSGNCTSNPEAEVPGETTAPQASGDDAGQFEIVGESGVPAMHAGLLPNGKVVFLDKVENYTQVKLDTGYYAYSSEYDPDTNTYTALPYKTNAFCSGGCFLANGDFLSLGGNAPLTDIDPTVGDGFDAIRYLKRAIDDPSLDGNAWSEPGNKLASARWYASALTLANGEVFVTSGSLNGLDPTVPANNNPTWELLDKTGTSYGVNNPMEILVTNQPYYMYPFMHLLKNGDVFVFVSKSAEIFNVGSNTTVLTLPDLAGDYRTYPNTGGSVLLPLSADNDYASEIVVCGGGSYQDITSPTDASCGRIKPEDDNPEWELEGMPVSRDMIEGVLLPDGTTLWLNGGHWGSQGFNLSRDAVLEALLYNSSAPSGSRFTVLASSTIARLYHSVALLIPDGTVLVAGSNPVEQPVLTADEYTPYVTEFRVEIFTPPYLMGDKRSIRPYDVSLDSTSLSNGNTFDLTFSQGSDSISDLKVVLYHTGFVTHSVHMGHRMVYLEYTGFESGKVNSTHTLTVSMPGTDYMSVTPPGPYLVFVVADGIPSVGASVMVNEDV
ncbi:glyoxal oxidase N-terminus-domain-containing protein [Myxozyma melibiosi]|uniref:Glyoxal oxidase N-terminus-domain-containing protein n=1 Tax=Myxozyma melibiosi TaxID=54550 RepID=A0ABR1F3S6_9ASCO